MWISLLILKTNIAILQSYDQSYLIIDIDWITYLSHINRSYTAMPCILGTNWHTLTSLVLPSRTNFQTRQPHNEGMLYRPSACSTPLSNGEKPYDFQQKIRESLEPRLCLWVKNHEMHLSSGLKDTVWSPWDKLMPGCVSIRTRAASAASAAVAAVTLWTARGCWIEMFIPNSKWLVTL